MGSTANDKSLKLWALAVPVSLEQSIGRVVVVNQAQPTRNCGLELWFPQRPAGKSTALRRAAESLLILVLVRGSVAAKFILT